MNWFKGYACGLLLVFVALSAQAQSPHGKDLAINCGTCHTADSWTITRDSLDFDHSVTRFNLEGQHAVIDCRQCHSSLEFSKAETNCSSCHLDMHQNTVGDDCARCHDSQSWLVNNIAEVHRQAAFPLFGAHAVANCVECHTSDTELRFDPMPSDCYSCHQADYASTTNPEHAKAGFSTDCSQCHKDDAFSWDAKDFNHDFFPLTAGHAIDECARCHTGPDYSKTPTDCLACHEQDYMATTNPNHPAAGIETTCAECHTTQPGWKPANFREHDQLYFPVYSGSHQGVWDQCLECHTDPSQYAEFTCITCHTNPTTNEEHAGVFGYSYSSTACLACHPDGESEGAFDHNNTDFPLTGAHTTIECLACHSSGFTGTPTACFACHDADFNQSSNPNHPALGLSTDCVSCHTTAPEWNPAAFPVHNEFYVLSGAHAIIANDCASCHMGDYNNTPTTCVGCHLEDYNQTTDPSHVALSFSTDCASCHSENAWSPAAFDHDDQYFPIYSGSHHGVWSACTECHTTPGNFAVFTCVTCHANPETNEEHSGVAGYSYSSTACLACHPNGEADGAFDHNNTNFPLTGAHTSVECINCHQNGYTGTPTDCQACHTQDYNQTTNPQHVALGVSTDCASCHTTDPGWSPATFDVHNDYYALNGAHALISNQCATCHQGDYTSTPNTCTGCHLSDYQQTTNPPHGELQFSQDCATCHTETAWEPSTFDHDVQHFPIYSGSHQGVWSQCSECHQTPGNFALFTCVTCHANPETDEGHSGVSGYMYNDAACLACHPNGEANGAFDHNSTAFPLTGAHITVNCLECHAAGYAGTPTDCAACHTDHFNQSTNPNHMALGIPTDCASCHTTAPDWNPAAFPIHNDYYTLSGAHALIADQCVNCHNGDYNNTPNTCTGCHQEDYNQTTNPSHFNLQFSQDCASCHNESAWQPSSFPNHNDYYVLQGAHAVIANECATCHNGDYNNTPNTCTGCHQEDYNQTTNPSHLNLQFSQDCASCHNESAWQPSSFPNHNDYYVLQGAHAVIANECAACHNGDYNNTPNTCFGCHSTEYNESTNPPHITTGFGTDCASCHNESAWTPANFNHDQQYFPIYSGAHLGTWDQCSDCHTNPNDFSVFTCITCHTSAETNDQHTGVDGYAFNSDLCLACHPTGDTEGMFDHNNSGFPLTGAHTTVDCMDCHAAGFEGTPTDCNACHTPDYNQSTNPNHLALNFPVNCVSCHTTDPDWMPATFDIHNDYYPLNGAHALIANQCATCHNGDYNNTPNTCVGCHQGDYNQTDNPNHQVLNFSTDCASCHSETAWSPASYEDHDDQYFPIYSGAHLGTWDQCNDCHTNPNNYSIYTCVTCHASGETGQQHIGINGYFYESSACLACHPTGDSEGSFDHNSSDFPLTGAHTSVACVECHSSGYQNTPTECSACHTPDFNQSSNPNHVSLGLSMECVTCHTTDPDWNPALFPDHNDYYPLLGAHAGISNQCVLCHNGDYNNTPNTCFGCHEGDYNQTNDPDHQAAQFPTNCETCHNQNAWVPSSWDHDGMYFPIYSGKHEDEWNQCSDCHTNPNNYSIFTCITCHEQAETDEDHDEVGGYQYNSSACLACHPDGED
jgi:hypothetical protein